MQEMISYLGSKRRAVPMKRLLTVAAALALMSTASFAAPTKKDVFDLYRLHYDCGWAGDVRDEERGKACKAEERAIKKLDAQGYCFVGHGMIGQAGKWMSKDRKHCYYLKEKRDARIIRYIKQYESESEKRA